MSDPPLAGMSEKFEPEPSGGPTTGGDVSLQGEQVSASAGSPLGSGNTESINQITPGDVEISTVANTPTFSSNLASGTHPGANSAQNTSRVLPEGITLWRGLRNTNVTDPFSQIGGTEMAFMSTTTNISIAVSHAMSPDSLLFMVKVDSFMSIGADIDWLSTFPGEGEFLFPPLTYLKPTGRVASDISIKKGREVFNFTVVEVKPFMG